jgi:hypothetical protein
VNGESVDETMSDVLVNRDGIEYDSETAKALHDPSASIDNPTTTLGETTISGSHNPIIDTDFDSNIIDKAPVTYERW